MLAARPRIPPCRPIGIGQRIPVSDVAWKSKWSYTITNIIAILMIICIVVLRLHHWLQTHQPLMELLLQ
jgi:hypothetical protein